MALFAPAHAGDSLTIGIRQFPTNLHPLYETTVAKSYVLGFVRRPITAHDKNWRLTCLMCRRLPTLANGLAELATGDPADGGTVTLTLPADARWGDGHPLTTRDVIFTWEVGRHPASGVAKADAFRRITRIDAVDAHTARLHFDRMTFDYNNFNDFLLLPAHLEKAAFEADPAGYRNRSLFSSDTANPGLYFGPYLISRIVAGSHVVLTRNPHWWGLPAPFERIVVKTVENTAALVANLLSGDIDMIAGEAGVSIDQALRLEQDYPGRFNVDYQLGLNFEHIDLNLDNDILADVRVRRALLYAIDRDKIVRTLFAGRYRVAQSTVAPLDPAYNENVPVYRFDPEKAARLLEEAGWRPGSDGLRRDDAGRALRLELLTTAGHAAREDVVQVLQDQWRQVGIDVRLKIVPARVLFGPALFRRNYSAMAMYAYITSPEWVPRSALHSDAVPAAANNWSGYNFSGFRDSQMDAVIEALETELDPERREALWHRYQTLFAEKVPVLPLYFYALAYVLPKWLTGVEPTGHNSFSTLWAERWRVER